MVNLPLWGWIAMALMLFFLIIETSVIGFYFLMVVRSQRRQGSRCQWNEALMQSIQGEVRQNRKTLKQLDDDHMKFMTHALKVRDTFRRLKVSGWK